MKLEKGGGSQNGKPTRDTCGNKHYGECLRGTVSCFGCVKEGHQLGDCPTIEARERKGKQVASKVPKDDVPNKRCVYALRTRGANPDEKDGVGKFLCFFEVI